MKQLPHGLDIILSSPLYRDIDSGNFIKQLQMEDLESDIHYMHFQGCMYTFNSPRIDNWGWIQIDDQDQLMELNWMMMDDFGDLVPRTHIQPVREDDQVELSLWLYFGATFGYGPVNQHHLDHIRERNGLKSAFVVDAQLGVWLIYPTSNYGEWNLWLEKQPPFKTIEQKKMVLPDSSLCDGSWELLVDYR